MRTALSGIVLVSVAALVGTGLGVLLFGSSGEFQQRVMLSAVIGAFFGSSGLLSTVRFTQWWLPNLLPVVFAMSCAGSVLALAVVWGLLEPGGVTWRLATTVAIVAVTVSHVALLATFPSRRTVVWACRSLAMLIAMGVGFLVIGALWGSLAGGTSDVFYSWLTAALILDVLGTLGVVLLSRRFVAPRREAAARATAGRFAQSRGSAREPGPSF